MHSGTGFLVALVALTAMTQTPASALPYDPYPWCANYESRGFGGSNCGFSTWNQCMATSVELADFAWPINSTIPAMPPPDEPVKKDNTDLGTIQL